MTVVLAEAVGNDTIAACIARIANGMVHDLPGLTANVRCRVRAMIDEYVELRIDEGLTHKPARNEVLRRNSTMCVAVLDGFAMTIDKAAKANHFANKR